MSQDKELLARLKVRFDLLQEIEDAEAALLEAEKTGSDKAMWEARIVLSKASIAFEEMDIANSKEALAVIG